MKCELAHNDDKYNLPGLASPIEICPFSNKIIISSTNAKIIVGKDYWERFDYEVCDKDLEQCIKNHPERLPYIEKELERLNIRDQEKVRSRTNFLKNQGFYQEKPLNFDKPEIDDSWSRLMLEYL